MVLGTDCPPLDYLAQVIELMCACVEVFLSVKWSSQHLAPRSLAGKMIMKLSLLR